VVMGLDNPIHIVFIVVILLLVFGAKRLPEIGRSLGGGMREFKDSVSGNGGDSAHQQTLTPAAQQPPAPVAQPAAQPPVAAPPTPVQAAAPPVAAPPTPTQVAPAPVAAPVEPQPEPQHQA
jgi:sec-independent protein translocase protein TatA